MSYEEWRTDYHDYVDDDQYGDLGDTGDLHESGPPDSLDPSQDPSAPQESEDDESEQNQDDDVIVIASMPSISLLISSLKCLGKDTSQSSHLVISFHKKYIMMTHSGRSGALTFVVYIEEENLLQYEYTHSEPSFQAAYSSDSFWRGINTMKPKKDSYLDFVVNKNGRFSIYNHTSECCSHIYRLSADDFRLTFPTYSKSMKSSRCRVLASTVQDKISKITNMNTVQGTFFVYGYEEGLSIDAYGEKKSINTTCIGSVNSGYAVKAMVNNGDFTCVPTNSERDAGVIRKFAIEKSVLKIFNGILKLCPKESIVKILIEEWKPMFLEIRIGTLGKALVFIKHEEFE